MSNRKEYLQRRRERLVMQAEAQRCELSTIATHLQMKLQWVDRGFSVGQVLRAHPVLTVAAASLLLRASRSNRWIRVGQLFTAWEIISIVRKQWVQYRR